MASANDRTSIRSHLYTYYIVHMEWGWGWCYDGSGRVDEVCILCLYVNPQNVIETNYTHTYREHIIRLVYVLKI